MLIVIVIARPQLVVVNGIPKMPAMLELMADDYFVSESAYLQFLRLKDNVWKLFVHYGSL